MPLGFRNKDGSKLGFQPGHTLNVGKNIWLGKTGKDSFNYKHGLTTKQHYCMDCNAKVSTYTVKRCLFCAAKYRASIYKNPMTGKFGSLNPNFKGGKPNCLDCGKQLSTRGSKSAYYKRCMKCKAKLNLNPNWMGGISFHPYPIGWNKTFKEQIRYRDGYKCQICSKPEVECRRKLDIHHIDYNKSNLAESNLISLCGSCHVKTNYNRDYWLSYFNVTTN